MENGVKNLKGARLFPKPYLITKMEKHFPLFIGHGSFISIK
jgi:hypothetical protein